MGVVVYGVKPSPPVRSVLLTVKALGIDAEFKVVDLLNGAHLAPEYIKMNPQHTVPTLDDNGFFIWDSHAINAYLVTKYGKTDALYPKDPQKRAIVDQRLHFDSGVLFPRGRNIVFPILFLGNSTIPEEKKKEVIEGLEMLNTLLGDNQWVAGNEMTIADFCCVATVSTLYMMLPEIEKLPKLSAWFKRCQTQMTGYKEANQEGVDIMTAMLKKKLEG